MQNAALNILIGTNSQLIARSHAGFSDLTFHHRDPHHCRLVVKNISTIQETEEAKMDGKENGTISGLEFQHDDSTPPLGKENHDAESQPNGIIPVEENSQLEETDDTQMGDTSSIAVESEGDKLLNCQKHVTFPSRREGENKVPTKSTDSSKPQNVTTSSASEGKQKAEDDPIMLVDPVIVRPHDFYPHSVQDFLLNYPDNRERPGSTLNLRFFNNEFEFKPGGLSIDAFHVAARRKFRFLENHHGYPTLPSFDPSLQG